MLNDLSSAATTNEEREAERKLRMLFRKFNRDIECGLLRERPKLFHALGDFARILPTNDAWHQFRKRWPNFFPRAEYEKVEQNVSPSVRDYSYWLDRIWKGHESRPALLLLLGVRVEAWISDEDSQAPNLPLIPAQFFPDWDEGVLRYRGMCMFQRALYLLFRESWRARTCEQCGDKFIARRVAQRYCSTDCSESVQRELKLKWWHEHGDAWRRKRKASKLRKRGRKNVTRKAR
jgi:hypothetical protein